MILKALTWKHRNILAQSAAHGLRATKMSFSRSLLLSCIPKWIGGWIGAWVPANPSFGMTKILEDAFLWHSPHVQTWKKGQIKKVTLSG